MTRPTNHEISYFLFLFPVIHGKLRLEKFDFWYRQTEDLIVTDGSLFIGFNRVVFMVAYFFILFSFGLALVDV